ncbi:MAG TPA: transposase [Burkholderiaceae bacterium]|nr:transposase [Burkholderiaceae bacterium]
MEEAKRVGRRKHDAQLKAQVVAECAAPGASIARVALEHGLNANLVHRWRRIAEGRENGGLAERPLDQFVALPLPTPAVPPPSVDIRIELRRGPTIVRVTWPGSAAPACAMWLRELLR